MHYCQQFERPPKFQRRAKDFEWPLVAKVRVPDSRAARPQSLGNTMDASARAQILGQYIRVYVLGALLSPHGLIFRYAQIIIFQKK